VRGILFDVDGTLYRQSAVRRWMLARLVRHCVANPGEAWDLLRGLQAYRRAQESLRREAVDGDLAAEQLSMCARATGIPEERVQAWVRRWIEHEPLPLLQRAVYPGMATLLVRAASFGYSLGVVSDYPTDAKLTALRLSRLFAVQVAAQDPEVRRFKPDPRGLQVALQRLGLAPDQAVYVGDRPEVDAEAARRAGMTCVILHPRARRRGDGYVGVRNTSELAAVLSLS
jgi:putative hydrolase of the HAD superfamily